MNNSDFVSRAEIHAAHRFHLRGTAVMVFVIYWLMIFTYDDFFLFDPSDSTGIFRQITLWLCLVGWILAATATPVLLMAAASGSRRALWFVPFTALWWPVSIVLAQISAYQQTSESFFNYLYDYPVFVVTDIALPAFILVKWSRMREEITKAEIAADRLS